MVWVRFVVFLGFFCMRCLSFLICFSDSCSSVSHSIRSALALLFFSSRSVVFSSLQLISFPRHLLFRIVLFLSQGVPHIRLPSLFLGPLFCSLDVESGGIWCHFILLSDSVFLSLGACFSSLFPFNNEVCDTAQSS